MSAFKPLPPSSPDPGALFAFDINVSSATIDEYLGNPDAVFYDTRPLVDTLDVEQLGFRKEVEFTIEGFRLVPYVLLGTVPDIGVAGRYTGPSLFDVEWDAQLGVVSAKPAYREAMLVLEDLFPKGRPLVMGCGGGGYAYMTKKLLAHLGWDEELLYNMGAIATYAGARRVQVLEAAADGTEMWATWRLDAPQIDLSRMTPTA